MTRDANDVKNEEPQETQERENDSENRDPIDVALFLLCEAFKR